MPRLPINYEKRHVYNIVSNDLNITECYGGHTTDFKSRRGNHKTRCNNENDKRYNNKLYQFIRNNGGWNNFDA